MGVGGRWGEAGGAGMGWVWGSAGESRGPARRPVADQQAGTQGSGWLASQQWGECRGQCSATAPLQPLPTCSLRASMMLLSASARLAAFSAAASQGPGRGTGPREPARVKAASQGQGSQGQGTQGQTTHAPLCPIKLPQPPQQGWVCLRAPTLPQQPPSPPNLLFTDSTHPHRGWWWAHPAPAC